MNYRNLVPKLADNRRKYTTEQRLDYVRRANEMRAQNPEITLKELGEELEVPATNLSDWMKGKCMKGKTFCVFFSTGSTIRGNITGKLNYQKFQINKKNRKIGYQTPQLQMKFVGNL